jgi:hypothetical protein
VEAIANAAVMAAAATVFIAVKHTAVACCPPKNQNDLLIF